MSWITYGSVFKRGPLSDSHFAEIDDLLAKHADELVRTRKGRVWRYSRRQVFIDVQIEPLNDVLWDCEDDVQEAGLLPEADDTRVQLTAPGRTDEAFREIEQLLGLIANTVDGVAFGPRRST